MGFRRRLIAAATIPLVLSFFALIASFNVIYADASNGFIGRGEGYAILGEHYRGYCGAHFSSVGDVNGDGIEDFIVGENGYSAGRAYLFYGRLDPSWSNLTLSDAEASFSGEAVDDWFGRWTTGLGDVNGDGYNDFAVSSMMNGDTGEMAGKVYLFFGSETGWSIDASADQANVSITGESSNDRLGHGVYGIGDTNGDDYDDFIVSGMMNDEGGTDAGQLYLFLGRPQNQWLDTYSAADANASWIGTDRDALSLDASAIGDVNNDGFADFAVGAIVNNGGVAYRQVFLIFGSNGASWSMDQPISESNASFVGKNNDYLETIALSANWVSGAGDFNNDGFDDIVIGAYEEEEESGITYIFFGKPAANWAHNVTFSSANASFVGSSADDWSGWAVDGVGDVNGDSYADVVIGASTPIIFPDDTLGAGQAYLILGSFAGKWGINTSLANANHTYITEQSGDGFGFHVQGIGDVNNDTLDDFAISAPYFDSEYSGFGKTYIILHQEPQITTTTTTSTTTATTTTPTTTTTTTLPFDPAVFLLVGGGAMVLVILVIIGRRRPQ